MKIHTSVPSYAETLVVLGVAIGMLAGLAIVQWPAILSVALNVKAGLSGWN